MYLEVVETCRLELIIVRTVERTDGPAHSVVYMQK